MNALQTWAAMTKPEHKGLSAKELRRVDPEQADKLADFLDAHRDQLVKEMAGIIFTDR